VNKHDWGRACRFFPGFRNSPGVIRTAWELCDLFNEELACAYPTRETLARRLGSPKESVSRWLRDLSSSGAITCTGLRSLSPAVRSEIGRSAKRAQVYELNFGWATDVLIYRDQLIFIEIN